MRLKPSGLNMPRCFLAKSNLSGGADGDSRRKKWSDQEDEASGGCGAVVNNRSLVGSITAAQAVRSIQEPIRLAQQSPPPPPHDTPTPHPAASLPRVKLPTEPLPPTPPLTLPTVPLPPAAAMLPSEAGNNNVNASDRVVIKQECHPDPTPSKSFTSPKLFLCTYS